MSALPAERPDQFVFDVIELRAGKGILCRRLLESLPEWFGIPAAIDDYVAAAETLPVLAAVADGAEIGLVTLKFHTEAAVELYVMAVSPDWHRRGVGRALITAAERMARSHGARFMTVKTLAPAHPDPHYARTRQFYASVGFVPIEVFPTLWGEHNPCLLMLKPLGPSTQAEGGE